MRLFSYWGACVKDGYINGGTATGPQRTLWSPKGREAQLRFGGDTLAGERERCSLLTGCLRVNLQYLSEALEMEDQDVGECP